jgi:hypothetical protein
MSLKTMEKCFHCVSWEISVIWKWRDKFPQPKDLHWLKNSAVISLRHQPKSRINVDQCFYDLVRLIRTRRALKSIEIPGGYHRGSLRLTIDLDWLFRRQKPGVLSQNLPIQEYVALTRQLVQAAKANDKRERLRNC